MKNLFLFLFLLTILYGCVTRKACDRKFPYLERDSVSVVSNTVTVIRDTTIYIRIPGDTVFRSLPASNEISKLSTPMATSEAWIKDGKLNHRLEQKDTVVGATIMGAVKTTQSLTSKNKVIHGIEYVNRLTRWQRVQIWMGRVVGLSMVVILIFRLIMHFTSK